MTAAFSRHQPLPENVHLIPDDAECVFKGVLFDVYQWQQEMFDGSVETFEMLRRPDAVLIIGIDGDEVVVIDDEQPGKPVTRDRLPGGRIEADESVLEAAKREMREETGMQFEDWSLLEVMQPAVKIEWFVYVYVAHGKLADVPTQHDVGEKIVAKRVSFDSFKALHDNRLAELRDVSSIEELFQKVNLS